MRVTASGQWRLAYLGPDGRRGWDVLFPNGITYEGSHYLLNGGFRGGSLQPNWFVGLLDDAGYVAVSDLDTHGSHAGWAEFVGVFGSNRAAWNPLPASGGVITQSPPSVLAITAAGSVRGALLGSRQPVGLSPAAVLYATGAASSGLAVAVGGTVTITYQLRLRAR